MKTTPTRASSIKRWPIIRHVRYFILRYRMYQHYDMWREMGALPVYIDKDIEVLDAIWRGER